MTLLSLPVALVQTPLVDAVIISRQGQRRNAWHHGIDLSREGNVRGATILPVAPGVVERVCLWPENCCGGYGNTVLIRHGDDLYSFYAHLDRVDVVEGQEVDWSTALGAVGDTFANFRAEDCPQLPMVSHLHLELRHADGSRYDALQVLAAGGLRVGSGGLLERTEPFEYEDPRLADATVKSENLPEVIVGNPAYLLPSHRRRVGAGLLLSFGILGILVGVAVAHRGKDRHEG